MPLIRQYWLARKEKKQVALEPVIDRTNPPGRVDFRVVEGEGVTGDPGEATTALGDILCLLCRQAAKGAQVRAAAKLGKMSAAMTSVVLPGSRGGKAYRTATSEDAAAYGQAQSALARMRLEHAELPLVPDEPMPSRAQTTGGVVSAFGIDTYGKLFNDRQLLALITFSRTVQDAFRAMTSVGLTGEYASALASYLALAVDRLADRASTLCRWDSTGESIMGTFGRQALPMVWDFVEVNPLSGMTGDFTSALDWITAYLDGATIPRGRDVTVLLRDARLPASRPPIVVVTDPPYYDAINYANLSDFFYVWLKRSLHFLGSAGFSTPLTPKRDQIVMTPVAAVGDKTTAREAARAAYVDGMAQAFDAMASGSPQTVGVVFAHTDPNAWGTLIDGLLHARLVPDASWPIDTELENKVSNLGQARLKTSVWMACRPREIDAPEAFLDDVLREMKPVIRERLLDFWNRGIRGADFFISAIGPALSVFGRHPRVLKPSGEEVSVREFLDIVRRESTEVALEQVLGGSTLGQVDPVTRLYLTWAWSYSKSALDAGDVHALGLATGTDYGLITRPGSIAEETREKSKKMVRLKTIADRGKNDPSTGSGQGLGEVTAGRAPALVDQLHLAAFLWSRNQAVALGDYREELGETRWQALRVLGQAVAECLPDGDEDRRLINGLLGSAAGASVAPVRAARPGTQLKLGE
jgi:adenine-specific DNA methylase